MEAHFLSLADVVDFSRSVLSYYSREDRGEMVGSANFEAALARGLVLGTGNYTGGEPHHQRHESGWTYENMYSPYEEEAFAQYFANDPILLEDVWVNWYGTDDESYNTDIYGEAYIVLQGGDRLLAIPLNHVVEGMGFDIYEEDDDDLMRGEWLAASVTNCPEKKDEFIY